MRTAPALLLSLSLLAASCGRPAQAPGAVAPRRPTAYELQLGKEVYQTYCAGCHGPTGAGDRFNAFKIVAAIATPRRNPQVYTSVDSPPSALHAKSTVSP